MNERIQELANRAIVERANGFREFDANVFAELIVRECAKVSERTGALNEADLEGEMIADAIKEHFGVK